MTDGNLSFSRCQRKASRHLPHELTDEITSEAAIHIEGIMAGYFGLIRVGMTEISGQFVAADINIMLPGQRLKFGERRASSQLLGDGEWHSS